MAKEHDVFVDCESGRCMGCQTYCCQLIIRLSPKEAEHFHGRRVLEQGDDGYCEYFNRENNFCGIWDKRPAVCRGYDCNHDSLLQVVFREGFTSLTQWLTSDPFIRHHEKRYVPYLPKNADEA